MKASIYARVSTSVQSAEMQIGELREYCQRRGWEIIGEYLEEASGSREVRPQLALLMAAARKREIDAVVVYRLDRLARSLKQLISLLMLIGLFQQTARRRGAGSATSERTVPC